MVERRWLIAGVVGWAWLVAWATAAPAQSFQQWAPTVTERVAGEAIPAEARDALEQLAAQAAHRASATIAWVIPARPSAAPAKKKKKVRSRKRRRRRKGRKGRRAKRSDPPDLLILATTSSAPKGKRGAFAGTLLLVRPTSTGSMLLAYRPVPLPADTRWQLLGATDVDGDQKPDALLSWHQRSRNFTRNGMVVARTRPPALALIELESETVTGRGKRVVEAQTACFFPVRGMGGKALIVQRRETTTVDGIQRQLDAMELFVPGGDGQLVDGHVFGAMYAGDGQERNVLRRWGKVFAIRRPEAAVDRQRMPGDCPAPGVVLPQRALGQSASPHPKAIVGPFATSSSGVRTALKAMGPRGPRAAVVIGIGSL